MLVLRPWSFSFILFVVWTDIPFLPLSLYLYRKKNALSCCWALVFKQNIGIPDRCWFCFQFGLMDQSIFSVLPVLFNVYHYSVFLLASCLIQWARVRQSLEGLCVYCLCLRNTLKKHSGLSIYKMIISVQEQNQTKVLSRDGFYNTFSYTFPCVDATLKNVERAKATVYRDFCTSYWKSASVLFWNMYILIW